MLAWKSGGRIYVFACKMEEKSEDSAFFYEEMSESSCHVSNLEQAEKLILSFEAKNTVKFSCYKADKNFGNDGKLINLFIYFIFFGGEMAI